MLLTTRPVRAFTAIDHARVVDALDFLPVLYPGGEKWLARRLNDVAVGDAEAFVVDTGNDLGGVAIGIMKSSARFKISTLFVAHAHRGAGLGRSLLAAMIERARELNAREVYITGATSVRSELQNVLITAGFRHIAVEPDRYGPGRDEDVYSLTL